MVIACLQAVQPLSSALAHGPGVHLGDQKGAVGARRFSMADSSHVTPVSSTTFDLPLQLLWAGMSRIAATVELTAVVVHH